MLQPALHHCTTPKPAAAAAAGDNKNMVEN
jgi:hypothetical protein